MFRSKRFSLLVTVFLAVCSQFLLPSACSARGTTTTPASLVKCTPADFDSSLQFFNGPGDYFTIVLNERVVSIHSCIFDSSIPPPAFVFDDSRPFVNAKCPECDDHLSDGQHLIVGPIQVDPGQLLQQTFRWRTSPTTDSAECRQPKWMVQPVLLTSQTLLKIICSDIEVSQFRLITASIYTSTQEQPLDHDRGPAFILTSAKSLYYASEPFDLHVSLPQPTLQGPSKDESCPTLYMKHRSPDGMTRLDEVHPVGFKGCRMFTLGRERGGDWESGFNLDSGANSLWEGLGEHTMQLSQLVASANDPQIHLASSNVLRIQIADPAIISRMWGPREKGVAIDLTLDKDTFQLGEDVPLHLAIEDFDAEVPVYSWDPLWDPCMTVSIEVQDATGRPLPEAERFQSWTLCMGHGFGQRPFPRGKLVPIERTLARQGWLPNRPGTYTIVVSWGPSAASGNSVQNGDVPTTMQCYAVARASATIHISDPDASHIKSD